MLNRWQAHKGAACGEVASIIMCLEVAQHCSTSSTPNDSEVPLPAGCAIAPPAVMHGLPSPMAHPRGGRRANYATPLQVGKAGLLSQIILKIELICVSQSPIRRFCESISITFAAVAGRNVIRPYSTAERGIAKRDTMSCEACDAEPTVARLLARGERQRNPG